MVAAKSSRVNRQYKKKYRIRNWREYERGLRSRGDVTIWLSEDAIAAWVPPKNGLRGGQRRYSNLAVRTALTLRVVFSLPLRQTEGFLDSLLRLMGLNLKAPDHTTLSRPEPNRCGAAPDPILRRPDRLDRRFHRAEDSGLRRMERAQAQGIKETPGLAEACTSGWMPRGSLWRPNSQRAAGTTPPHSLLFSTQSRFPSGVSPQTEPTTTGQSTINSARPVQRTS